MRHRLTLALAAWLLAVAILQPMGALGQNLPPLAAASGARQIGGPVPATPGTSALAHGPRTVPVDNEGDVLPEPLPRAPTLWDRWVTPDTAAYGVGAVIGIIAFYGYFAPIAAAAGPTSLRSWLGTRVMASTLAATGGVLTTYAYDLWANRPVDTIFFKSRAGAVAGVAAGSALLTGLGFPPASALVRFSPAWAANRSFLVGTGLLGESLAYIWLQRADTKPPP
jgi:hypothetical protein